MAPGSDPKGAFMKRGCKAVATITVLFLGAWVAGAVWVSTKPARAAFPGKNGRIAFVRWNGDGYTIQTINPDGTDPQLITVGYALGGPAWSPSGKKLAYSNEKNQIYKVNADGTHNVRLTYGDHANGGPAWSPSGKQIAFARGQAHFTTYEIHKMNSDGTGRVRLTHNNGFDANPSWSPNGKKIVFEVYFNRLDHKIYKMNPDGTGRVRLTKGSHRDYSPAWSPDGSKIVFMSVVGNDFEIFKMNPDGTGRVRLTDTQKNEGTPTWSPNGKKIAFDAYGRRTVEKVYKMNPDGSHRVLITGGVKSGSDSFAPNWGVRPRN